MRHKFLEDGRQEQTPGAAYPDRDAQGYQLRQKLADVIIRPAMEAASCKAMRTTLAGSMMPLEHVAALISLDVIAERRGSLVHDLAGQDQALNACILRDLAD